MDCVWRGGQVIGRWVDYILEGMMEMNETRQRSLMLRKNIRRMELDSYFQERRQELLLHQDSPTPSLDLNSLYAQEHFIEEAARELTGDPKPEWLPTILRLHKSVMSFNGNFDSWFKSSIIRSLRESLRLGFEGGVAEKVV